MEKTSLEFNKPIYVGFSIFDLSKYLMYEFHYDVMLKNYEDKLRLCYQDTDSLIYEVQTEDIYKDIGEMKEWFDFSDYPKDHPLYDECNKKVKNVTKTLKLDDFKRCLLEGKVTPKEQFMIKAKKHQIYTLKQNKVALNEDDKEEIKRYICKNKINALAHGHYKI